MSGSKVTITVTRLTRDRLESVLQRTGMTLQAFCAAAIEGGVEDALDPSPPPITYAEIAAENALWMRAMLTWLYCDEGDEEAKVHATRIADAIRASRSWPQMRRGWDMPVGRRPAR